MSSTLRTMRVAFFAFTLVAVVGIPAAFANGSKEQGPKTSSASAVTTIVWTAGGLAQNGTTSAASAAEQLIAAFEKSHPDIKVTLEREASNVDTARSALTVQISGGATTPDLYGGGAIWPPLMAEAGLAMKLDGVFPDSFWNYTSADILNGSIYQGHKYAVPTYADVPLLYYRKDLLESQNMQVPKTWEQLQSEALALEQKGLVKYGFAFEGKAYEGATWSFLEFLHQAGGAGYTADGKPSLNTPLGEKALGFMRALITNGVAPSAVTTFTSNESQDLFSSGELAFMRNWTGSYPILEQQGSKVRGKVGLAPLPTFAGQTYPGQGALGGWELLVNPNTKNLDAVKQFITWVVGPEGETIIAKSGLLPTNTTVKNHPPVALPVYGAYADARVFARPTRFGHYNQVSNAIYTNVNAALAGQESVNEALQRMQTKVESIITNKAF